MLAFWLDVPWFLKPLCNCLAVCLDFFKTKYVYHINYTDCQFEQIFPSHGNVDSLKVESTRNRIVVKCPVQQNSQILWRTLYLILLWNTCQKQSALTLPSEHFVSPSSQAVSIIRVRPIVTVSDIWQIPSREGEGTTWFAVSGDL